MTRLQKAIPILVLAALALSAVAVAELNKQFAAEVVAKQQALQKELASQKEKNDDADLQLKMIEAEIVSATETIRVEQAFELKSLALLEDCLRVDPDAYEKNKCGPRTAAWKKDRAKLWPK